ncbi:hypothetical protein F5890DRAFT_1607346 [Lentinula detonsa]|uniref:Integrase zinc-binding domain-containing protein n=1 Tax=Lentinula detonsa TaxID=2804962 RepID=A0AA38PV03_9AGAR|nr:hypothetical protein F5890DRAFT_1607346 [Lentinula detonsa]
MAPSSCVRLSSQELAQLQSSVKTLEFPSRQNFDTVQAQFAAQASENNHKSSLPKRNYEYIMFCLGTSELKALIVANFELAPKDAILEGKGDFFLPADSASRVLIWKGRVVVPQNLLYDAVQYSHRASNHGDSLRTLAVVRKYYAFVPSLLVQGFVDACPTCAARRGTKEYAFNNITDSTSDTGNAISFSNSFDLLAISDSQNDELSTLSTSSPFIFSGHTLEGTESIDAENLPAPPPLFSRLSTASGGLHDGLPQSLPMSREVSLFKGIPNGWQYFTNYDVAHQDFVDQKAKVMSQQLKPLVHQKRPRIPSIAPLSSTNFNAVGTGRAGSCEGNTQTE